MKKKQLKQIENQAQDGRSMVEMLGVLAIIGVISIGGIAGYRMAMNRYQANQIANEINLMRTDAKIKVARGVELLLGEPYDGESGHLKFNESYGVKVDSSVIISDGEEGREEGYSFTLSNIPEGVCKPLATLLDGMDDTAVLEINGGDYTTTENPCSETENEVMVAFSTKDIGGVSGGSGNPEPPEEQGDEPQDEPECNEDTCPGGTCNEDGTCQCPENKNWTGTDCITCPEEAPWNDTERDCTCTGANEYWDGNRCITCDESTGGTWDEENKECKCDEGKYWSDSAGACIENPCNSCADDEFCLSSSCNECSSYGISSSETITEVCISHSCKKISEYKADNKDTEHPNKYVMSKSRMNWWSAERFCKALPGNRHMVTISDLNCKNTNLGGTTTGYCYAKDGSGSELSDVIKALRKAENGTETSGNRYYWLYNSFGNTTPSSNSCTAYYVCLDNGVVSDRNRARGGIYYALCE